MHHNLLRCRLAARDVTVIYNTTKAWTAMPRFADWRSWENLIHKRGNIVAAHAYSVETAVPILLCKFENFSGFQSARISITLSFPKCRCGMLPLHIANIIIFSHLKNFSCCFSNKFTSLWQKPWKWRAFREFPDFGAMMRIWILSFLMSQARHSKKCVSLSTRRHGCFPARLRHGC